jgi:hypothetical protein
MRCNAKPQREEKPPMNKYILIGEDILTVDTYAERVEARKLMADAGIDETMIYLGGPEEDHGATGELLNANQAHEPKGSQELLSDERVAEMLQTLIDGNSDDAMRDEVFEDLEGLGAHIEVNSFRDAGILTSNAGFVIRVGGQTFQVSVVS